MALRKVDLGILVLCALAIMLSMHQEGDLALTPSWVYEIDSSTFANGHAPDISERLPRPIVTDLDGDGTKEIVLCTRKPSIEVLQLPAASTGVSEEHYEQLELVASASLLGGVSVAKGRHPVAMATGYLRKYSKKRIRKQVIVVLTEGWSILCFTRRLKLMWERTMEVSMTHSFINEAALLVTSHRMRVGDRGAVIVGGRLADRNDPKLHTLKTLEKEQALRAVPEDGDQTVHETLGQQHHFTMYAFEGKTGQLRWKHEAGTFHGEVHPHDLLHPQHEAQSGEVDWRNFRHSIMHSLPHLWTFREDTAFVLAHFEKRRPGKDRHHEVQKRARDALPHTHSHLGLKPHTADEHVRKPNALVTHVRDGIEVIHLFTGRPLCRISLKTGVAHVDVNGDGVIDHVEAVAGLNTRFARTRTSNSLKVPRCLALITTGVPPTHQLYNGSMCSPSGGSLLKPFQQVIMEAIDHSEQQEDVLVANPTLIRHKKASNSGRFSVGNIRKALRSSKPKRGGGSRTHRHTLRSRVNKKEYDSVFLVSSGIVSSYAPNGFVRWQTTTECKWTDVTSAEDSKNVIKSLSLMPSVNPYRVWHAGPKDHLICIGAKNMEVLNAKNGHMRASTRLEDTVVSAPVVGDFNNDGWNDVILVTAGGYYGYVLERRVGLKLFSILTGALIIALVLAFVFHLNESPSTRRVRRGRTDTQPRRYGTRAAWKSSKAQL